MLLRRPNPRISPVLFDFPQRRPGCGRTVDDIRMLAPGGLLSLFEEKKACLAMGMGFG